MKKTYKALSVLMIVLMIAFACTPVFAANNTATTDIYGTMTGQDDEVDVQGIANLGNKILTVITTVGMVLSVVIVAILGVKYMMGSTEEKAEYKKTMIPYLVGAVLVFGASAIGQMVYNFTKQ